MSTLADRQPWQLVTEFACRACGSPAVVYPDRLSDDAPVRCQRCRTLLCTLHEFRLSAEQGVAAMQIYADDSDRSAFGSGFASKPRSGWRLLGRLFRRLTAP
jgi:DNA-directed RNA polymerase subunit RPC12/RpoP